MIVYQATKSKFLHDCDHDQIEDVVQRAFVQKTQRYATQSEFKAWRNSLVAMARVLRDTGGSPLAEEVLGVSLRTVVSKR